MNDRLHWPFELFHDATQSFEMHGFTPLRTTAALDTMLQDLDASFVVASVLFKYMELPAPGTRHRVEFARNLAHRAVVETESRISQEMDQQRFAGINVRTYGGCAWDLRLTCREDGEQGSISFADLESLDEFFSASAHRERCAASCRVTRFQVGESRAITLE
jgi:hypothetical protein